MKRSLCVLLLLLSVSAHASSRRGWLTGAGLGAFAAGLGAGAAGLVFTLRAGEAKAISGAYYANNGAPTSAEAPWVRFQDDRAQSQGLGIAFLATGGALMALGIAGVVLDGVLGTGETSVALVPTAGGAAFSVSLRF